MNPCVSQNPISYRCIIHYYYNIKQKHHNEFFQAYMGSEINSKTLHIYFIVYRNIFHTIFVIVPVSNLNNTTKGKF